MQQLLPRFAIDRVQLALADTPVVLVGPRQCGKTTLVRGLADEGRPYFTLDDDTVLAASQSDPAGFLRGLDGAVIDEVQRSPGLLRTLATALRLGSCSMTATPPCRSATACGPPRSARCSARPDTSSRTSFIGQRPMRPAPLPDTAPAGFSLLELMVVVAVIAILSMMAVPSFLERTVRRQIEQSMPVADVAKPPLAAAWAASQPWPADNAAAGLPAPDKITGQYVASVTLDGGAIQVVFGNNANARIQGKTLSIRPAVSAGAHVVPIAWVCGRGAVPGSMTVQGVDRTDIDATLLPVGCR